MKESFISVFNCNFLVHFRIFCPQFCRCLATHIILADVATCRTWHHLHLSYHAQLGLEEIWLLWDIYGTAEWLLLSMCVLQNSFYSTSLKGINRKPAQCETRTELWECFVCVHQSGLCTYGCQSMWLYTNLQLRAGSRGEREREREREPPLALLIPSAHSGPGNTFSVVRGKCQMKTDQSKSSSFILKVITLTTA